MATKYAFGQTVTNGLVLALDAADKNSYPGSGTVWSDLTGNRNSGSLVNTPTFSSNNGGYFTFNATNQYASGSNNTILDSQTITMESWNYPSSIIQNGFLFEKGAVNTQYSNFYNGDGNFYFRTTGLSSPSDLIFTVSSYISVNTWNHIVCTYSGGNKNIYVNNQLAAMQTGLTGTISTNNSGFFVGAYNSASPSYFFNGRIAIIKVYNRALSSTEVAQNYNAQKSRFGL
jgi:hypothetical protein